MLLVAIIFSTTFYLSYPQRDPYIFNKSLNTTSTDLNIVHTIESQSSDYIVLANQAVSAAAISEYGFNKYFKDNIFYYPLPTSGPLYQLYLQLAYQQSLVVEVLDSVKNLTGVNNIYFVINSYWSGYNQIVSEHKKTAESWQQIDNKATIFYYNLADKVSQ